MARVRFEDGTVINFNGMPSQADIEEAYSSVKGKKSSGAGGSFGSETDISAQVAKGLYEKTPFAKRVLSTPGVLYNPNAEKSMAQVVEPKGMIPKLARKAGEIAPDFVISAPFFKGASLIPKVGFSVKAGIGAGAYEGAKAIAEGKGPIEGTKQALGGFGAGLGAGLLGVGAAKAIKGTPGAIKSLSNLPNKVLRGGLSPEEAQRIATEYGNSNATLVDKLKGVLRIKESEADNAYRTAFANAPQGKQINIRPAIEEAGKRLKKIGLITDKGNLTELGTSEIAKDSVYGKLLDFYKSADAISGVGKLEGKALTGNQMARVMSAERQTLVNPEQYTFFRDKLNTLYKNKPSDIDVSKVVNQFYADGESSGIKGLQQARKLQREFFNKQEQFLNKNTGDLKIATEQKLSRVGTDKNLSKQELDHIKELENYTGIKIIDEASKINTLNRAKEVLKKVKTWGLATAVSGTGLEGGRKLITGKW